MIHWMWCGFVGEWVWVCGWVGVGLWVGLVWVCAWVSVNADADVDVGVE